MTRRRRRHGGQGLAEFALVLPLLMLIVFGIVDFSRAVFIYSVVQDAAREGARYAIVHGSLSESLDSQCASGPGAACDPAGANVANAAKAYAIGLDPTQFTSNACWGFACTISRDCTTAANASDAADTPLTPVTVASCYDFQTIVGSFLPFGTIRLRATATLTINH